MILASAARAVRPACGKVRRVYCCAQVREDGKKTAEEVLGMSVKGGVHAMLNGAVRSQELVEESVRRLQRDAALFHTMISVSNSAMGEAMAIDEQLKETGKSAGPLHGIPVVVSDDIHVKGFPTTLGCSALSRYVPSRSAPVVEALVSAGAVIVGKANLDELGMGKIGINTSTGSLVNPLDPSFYIGGSQGGCASAVLSECVPLAVGTDVSGDISIPAGYAGVHGWVPTTGRFSRKRTWMMSTTQGSVGIVAKTIQDIKIVDTVLEASVLHNEDDVLHFHAGKPSEPLLGEKVPNILIPEDAFNIVTSPEVERLFRVTAQVLRSLGCTVSETIRHAQYGEMSIRPETDEGMLQDALHAGHLRDPENMTLRQVPHLWRMWSNGLDMEAVSIMKGVCEKAGLNWNEFLETISVPYIRKLVKGVDTMDAAAKKQSTEAREELTKVLQQYWQEVPKDVDALMFPICIAEPQQVQDKTNTSGLVTWRGVEAPSDLMTRNTGPFALTGCPRVTVPFCLKQRDIPSGGILLVGRPGEDHALLETAAIIDQQIKAGSVHLSGIVQQPPDTEDAWLEDRSKNSFASMYDHDEAAGKAGHYTIKLGKERHLYPGLFTEKTQERLDRFKAYKDPEVRKKREKGTTTTEAAASDELEIAAKAAKAAKVTEALKGFRE